MKISLFYEFPLPRPWSDDDEHQLFQDGLDEVEAADKAGFSTVWLTEHHFLEEYCHSTAPEIFLAAASQRTKDIRLGFGIMHLPPAVNHPARVAERVSTLDLISNGRVEFGTGESSSVGELGGFGIDPADKRTMWEEALEVSIRCMIEEPFTGFKGQHIEMPPRNVVPKPLQKPHPPVWVACTRPASVSMAAQRGLGALSFAYTGPGPLTERVNGYYKEFEENGAPVTPQMNPNILAIGGDLSMMVAPTDEQAVERLGMGGGFFAFGIMHYYMTGMHTPGRTGVWKRHLEEIEKDPTIVYGPGRGPIGSPATVREFLRGYEESGVDELIVLLTPRTHEATMESIELMGKEVLPEFIERDEKAVAEKAKRLEPIIEKAEARRQPSKAPAFDESYSFGGLPTGRENYTANEVSLGDGRDERRHRSRPRRNSSQEKGGRAGTRTPTRNEPWVRLTSCGATTAGGSSSPDARRASVSTSRVSSPSSAPRSSGSMCDSLRCSSRSSTRSTWPIRHRSTRPPHRSAAGSTPCSTSPACRRASAIRCGWSRSTSSAPGGSPRRWYRRCRPGRRSPMCRRWRRRAIGRTPTSRQVCWTL